MVGVTVGRTEGGLINPEGRGPFITVIKEPLDCKCVLSCTCKPLDLIGNSSK